MLENKYQRFAKLLWMLFVLFIGVTVVLALFVLSKNNSLLGNKKIYQQTILDAENMIGNISDMGTNFIRLAGDDNIYFYDSNTTWKEKDVKSNEYKDGAGNLALSDRVLLKVKESDGEYYIYEVRKEPSRSVTGRVIEVKDNVLVIQDWQENKYEINTSGDTQYFSTDGQGVDFSEIYPGVEVIVTSNSDDLGENIIRADYVEVVK